MPEAVFYILGAGPGPENERARFGCEVAQRCWRELERRLCIYVEDREQAEQIDDLLWTFHDVSFLPHQLADEELEPDPRITISWGDRLPAQKDVMINLTDQIPQRAADFSRVIEIVAGSEKQRQSARTRFRTYREQGYRLQHYELQSANKTEIPNAD